MLGSWGENVYVLSLKIIFMLLITNSIKIIANVCGGRELIFAVTKSCCLFTFYLCGRGILSVAYIVLKFMWVRNQKCFSIVITHLPIWLLNLVSLIPPLPISSPKIRQNVMILCFLVDLALNLALNSKFDYFFPT